MKKLYCVIMTCIISVISFAQTSGGPDTYGYTWTNSNNAIGPTYAWNDITLVGTQVAGLTDDNSVAFVPMGMNFHYYWSDYNQLKIGSNGWLSFNNVANIAHCFPVIPTAGGAGDNLLAPFMSDLIMNAAGSNPEVWYYYDASAQEFIVSYINIPWWQAAPPGYIGNNTFQVILSAVDSSITFQYMQADVGNLNDIAGCDQDLSVGIENITGGIGLSVHSDLVPNLPADLLAIKFKYPNTVTFNIKDMTPEWSQNAKNEAQFYPTTANIMVPTSVTNAGNTDVITSTNVNITVRNLAPTIVYTADSSISSLTAGSSQVINFDVTSLPAGQYSVDITTTNGNDINPSNNVLTTEIEVVDVTGSTATLTYATQNTTTTGLFLGGGASHFVPPVYPITLDAVGFFILGATTADYDIEIYADDGVNNSAGTLLGSETVLQGTYLLGWSPTVLSTPIVINSGGIYIAFIDTSSTAVLGTETVGPISRQSSEYVAGALSTYRENTNEELLINAYFVNLPVGLVETSLLKNITVYPNPSKGIVNIETSSGDEKLNIKVLNPLGQILSVQSSNKRMTTVDLTEYDRGIYFIRISTSKGTLTERIVLN